MQQLTPSQELSASQYLQYYPINIGFEPLLQLVRRDSISIKVKSEFSKLDGSVADYITNLEREVAKNIVLCGGFNIGNVRHSAHQHSRTNN